jgi:hypothetical protein
MIKSFAQVYDNGIGGYGFIQYNIMHNDNSAGNWITGGGGFILNKVYFAGAYYSSCQNQFVAGNVFNLFNKNSDNEFSRRNGLVGISNSEIGVQFGGIVFAEKTIQIIGMISPGILFSNYNEDYSLFAKDSSFYKGLSYRRTKPFFVINPEFKFALKASRLVKLQAGVGYKFCVYDNSDVRENTFLGDKKWLFNSFFWSLSLCFGSF